MTTDPHADLRAMLGALPNSSSLPAGLLFSERCWILSAPALVRALLDERDKLAQVADNTVDKPAEPITDELRLRCELAARLVPAWVVDQHFDDHNVSNAEVAQVAYNVVGALLAEGRRRMAAEREGKS